MNYVQHYEINGISTKQIACIALQGEPTAATEGAVGVLAIDVNSPSHDVYKCVGANNGIYTWELLSSGSGEGGSTPEVPTSIDLSAFDTDGTIVEEFDDGTTKTTTMEFDEDGNPIKIIDNDGNETVLTW